MSERKASDLLVECLESEGVTRVFGIPGEETLDVNESLAKSSIDFVAVRHEHGAALMAAMQGRLTGRAGVCLATLGPGATNLVSGIAHAFLDRTPLVALTAQAGSERRHKESHQHIDVLSVLDPVTKYNAGVADPSTLPELVRKAFTLAEAEKPGATHIELPEDTMAARVDVELMREPRRRAVLAPLPETFAAAAAAIEGARRPVILAGNGVLRAGASAALQSLARSAGIGVAETFMGKGAGPSDDLAFGTVGMDAADYELAGFEEADVVITVGYDLVEHAPSEWNPRRDKMIVCIDSVAPEADAHFETRVDLVGDVRGILSQLEAQLSGQRSAGREPSTVSRPSPTPAGESRLRALAARALDAGSEDDAFPMRPARVLWELRQALDPEDMLFSDVGLHKLWIARLYPALAPDSVFISNGLAGMGVAVPSAIGAKLLFPERRVVTVSGDGGVLMNCQELETAARLKTPVVNVVLQDGAYSMIVSKQDKKFGRHFGTDFGGTDFVALAGAFGLPGWRCDSAPDFGSRLAHALTLDVPSLLVVPIDYSQDVADLESLDTRS